MFSMVRYPYDIGKIKEMVYDLNNINEKNIHGQTLLHTAAWGMGTDQEILEIVKILFSAGILPHIRDNQGNTALDIIRMYNLELPQTRSYIRRCQDLITEHTAYFYDK